MQPYVINYAEDNFLYIFSYVAGVENTVDGGKARLQSYQMQSEIQQLLRTNRYDLCLVLR